MLQYRSVASVIILDIVTCGIYGLYWVYQSMREMELTSGRESEVNAVICLLLCIFIPPVGYVLYGNGADEQLNIIKAQRGIPTSDNKVVYMLLGFFLSIAMFAIVQDEMNKLV